MLQHTLEFVSFVRLNNLHYTQDIHTSLFVNPFIHEWTFGLFPPFLDLCMMLGALACRCMFEFLFSALWSIYLEVELVDHMVTVSILHPPPPFF
jgi:hypothetical protein